MKTQILIAILLLSQAAFSQVLEPESTQVFDIKVCRNSSANSVNFEYPKCVRENFAVIEKAMSIPLQKCHNDTAAVTPSFLKCISANFQKLINQTNLDVRFCYSNKAAMSSQFTSCVGQNFAQLQETFKVLESKPLPANQSGVVDNIPLTSEAEGQLAILDNK